MNDTHHIQVVPMYDGVMPTVQVSCTCGEVLLTAVNRPATWHELTAVRARHLFRVLVDSTARAMDR